MTTAVVVARAQNHEFSRQVQQTLQRHDDEAADLRSRLAEAQQAESEAKEKLTAMEDLLGNEVRHVEGKAPAVSRHGVLQQPGRFVSRECP